MTTLRGTPGTAAAPAAPAAPAVPASWPFTPIEELDFYLENAGEPSLVQLETHAAGHLDRVALAAAVTSVLAADPTARRRLAATSRWGRRLRWESGPAHPAGAGDRAEAGGTARAGDTVEAGGTASTGDTVEAGRTASTGDTAGPAGGAGVFVTVAWHSPAELAALRERLSGWPMSLEKGAVRVILAAGPAHDVVLQHTHHAAFDGISSLALLTAICAAYRERLAAGDDPITTTAQVTSGERAPGAEPAAFREPGRPLRPRPRPGAPSGAVTRIAPRGGQPGRPGYGAALRSIGVPRPTRPGDARHGDRRGLHQSGRRRARGGDGPVPTVNDLLVAALILTVDRWNAAHGRHRGTIRITVPVNTRDPRQRWAGPGNLSRLIRVTARPADRADAAGLLGHVAAQTRAGKLDGRPGLDAVSRLLAAPWAPAPVKRHTARLVRRLTRPLCTDTSLVSNLGVIPEPPSLGGGGREPLWFSGPAPMPRGLAVGAVTVAGRLHLSVHYRPALLDAGAAEDFTDGYCEALAELAELADSAEAAPLPEPSHGRPP